MLICLHLDPLVLVEVTVIFERNGQPFGNSVRKKKTLVAGLKWKAFRQMISEMLYPYNLVA